MYPLCQPTLPANRRHAFVGGEAVACGNSPVTPDIRVTGPCAAGRSGQPVISAVGTIVARPMLWLKMLKPR
jgi:hypothetical protein